MTLSLTCKHCRVTISGDDENELVARVQEHTRTHDRDPDLSAEHIRARLHRLQRTDHDG